MASVSGLVSGLDTATIINQLMQLEAIPQTQLKSRVSVQERAVKSLQTVNAKLASLATKAAELANRSVWSPTSATSSSKHVTVSTGEGATPFSLSFTVMQTAKAHQLSFNAAMALTDQAVAPGSSVELTLAGSVTNIKVTDGTLSGLVDAINDADAGVRATTIQLSNGTFRLLVSAVESGADSTFTLTNADGSDLLGGATPSVTGRDAAVMIGSDTITSATNTFTDVVPGLEFTIAEEAVDSTVNITVQQHPAAVADQVKALVESLNATLKDIKSLTGYDAATNTAGLLAGDSTLRTVANRLSGFVAGGIHGQSLAPYGVETDRYGEVTFDEEKFTKAFEADPAGTTALFAAPEDPEAPDAVVGFAAGLQRLAETLSDSYTGTVTLAIKGRNDRIDRMEDSIAEWGVRLDLRRSGLERQYAALEVALSSMQNQSQWLAGQIAGLPSMLGS